ncbi:MAG: DUF2142 domain-containing protein [Anaerolineales bacterium]|nr:DUF2142 domain-containing protein [Anaerolineales bacterium]MCB9128836.1 DUF2142 domain-containing protein [Ardenticatenales bacterium]MCB9171400.1 DUF2142 domain-containing protein [Ardenticatenales bacterium]
MLAIVYAIVTPPFEKPDEPWHFAYSMYVANTGRLPIQRMDSERQTHLAEQEGSQPPFYYLLHAALLRLSNNVPSVSGFQALTVPNPFYPGQDQANINQFLRLPCDDVAACRTVERGVMIGRALSILFGLIALSAAWWALRLAFPTTPQVGVMGVGLMAFTPMFLHISSSVSNDAATVAATTVALAAALWMREKGVTTRKLLLVGGLCGLATISKISGATVLPVVLMMGVAGYGLSQMVQRALLIVSGWLVVVSPWMIRNLYLYGEPTATAVHLQIYDVSATPRSYGQQFGEWMAVIDSAWGTFGWGALVLPAEFYFVVRIVVLILLGSAIWRFVRGWGYYTLPPRLVIAGAIMQIVMIVLLLAQWMRLTVAPLGRLLFPAYFSLCLILALGLLALVPTKRGPVAGAAVVMAWAVCATLIATSVIRPAYRHLPPSASFSNTAQRVDIDFGRGLKLIAYEMPSQMAHNGALPVTLHWQTEQPLPPNIAEALVLLDLEGNELLRAHSFPDGGRWPMAAWPLGESVTDRQRVVFPADFDHSSVRVGLMLFRYDFTSGATAPFADDWRLVELGRVDVVASY